MPNNDWDGKDRRNVQKWRMRWPTAEARITLARLRSPMGGRFTSAIHNRFAPRVVRTGEVTQAKAC